MDVIDGLRCFRDARNQRFVELERDHAPVRDQQPEASLSRPP